MPPTDRRLRPKLEHSMPADRVPGTTRVTAWPETWLAEFGSGEWHAIRIRARAKDHQGREVLDIEYHIEGGTWQDSVVADPDRLREPG